MALRVRTPEEQQENGGVHPPLLLVPWQLNLPGVVRVDFHPLLDVPDFGAILQVHRVLETGMSVHKRGGS